MGDGTRLHMTYGLNIGGCETQMFNLAQEYAKRGLQEEVIFCSFSLSGIAARKIEALGFQVYCLSLDIWGKPLRSLLSVIRFLRDKDIELLITTGLEANMFGCLAAKVVHISRIVTEEIGIRSYSIKQRIILRLSLRMADYNFAVSKIVLKNLLDQKLIRKERGYISYAPLDLKRKSTNLLSLEAKVNLLYLGRIHPEKNLELLISSLGKIRDGNYNNFQLEIVGVQNYDERRLIEEIVQLHKLEKFVMVFDATSNTEQHIDGCNFLVQSSRTEGMGFSVLEAMSRGRPVISTNVGIVPEIIDSGVNGLISKSQSQSDYMSVLLTAILMDRGEYDAMVNRVLETSLSFVETSTYLALIDSMGRKTNS
ncbi:unannotated protein [freshwater metagenome]|uniref:Unannotated protein n=1 Tax=freshwater metagenome TaxID=449393 RepID=A0A6J6ZN01_9ZZZZ